MVSSKSSWLNKILRSSRLLSQNKADFNNKRDFATTQFRHYVRHRRFYDPTVKQKDEKFFWMKRYRDFDLSRFKKGSKLKLPKFNNQWNIWSQAYENDPNSLKLESYYRVFSREGSVFYPYKSRSCESTVAGKFFEIEGVSYLEFLNCDQKV